MLKAVVVHETHPPQCLVVWDRQESADALRDHLNARAGRDAVAVRDVDSFFPAGMTDGDEGWLRMVDAYLAGAHHNTSGNP